MARGGEHSHRHRAAQRHVAAADPVMAQLMKRVGPVELPSRRRRFESLVRAIIAQQLSTSAARTIFLRVRNLCGGTVNGDRLALVTDAELRAAGLSQNKLLSVRDLSARCANRQVRLDRLPRLSDEDVVTELVTVRGIGRWSAEMFLIFVLGRLDVLPVQDLGVQKGFQKAYDMPELPDAARMQRIAAAWSPFRTVGTWYLWRGLELA